MNIHVCKQCGSHFAYCRKCVFRPVRYKDAGYCSKECYEASKNNVAVEETATVEIEEPIVEIEVLSIEDVRPVEEAVIEATPVVEPIIKKETNTYKKKKKKY